MTDKTEYNRGVADAIAFLRLSEFEYRGVGRNSDFNDGWKWAVDVIATQLSLEASRGTLEESCKPGKFRIEVSRDKGETWINFLSVGGKPKTYPTASHARSAWDDFHIDRECEWEYVRLVEVEDTETIKVVMDYSPGVKV